MEGGLFLRTYYKCIVCERIYLSDEGYPGTKKEWPRRCHDHENIDRSSGSVRLSTIPQPSKLE